jgi:hypothetical protein
MDTKAEALRRLGGPVCAVCSKVDLNATKQVEYDEEHLDWLSKRTGGRGPALMCRACRQQMFDHGVAVRAERAEGLSRAAAAHMSGAAEWLAACDKVYGKDKVPVAGDLVSDARDMCAADLKAAMDDAAAWQVGNGIFGGRYE